MNGRYKMFISGMTLSIVMMSSSSVLATNGMNLEGYGPEATALGGASMAYDNGTAASMNNPATLSLMDANMRLDAALGFLGPNVSSSVTGFPEAKSSATSFIMPAAGFARKQGMLTYGIGVFSQGGMGTEYAADSILTSGSGEKVRSEVGVGRFLLPVSYRVNDQVSVGGSVDYAWAGMDIKMALSGGDFGDMVAALGGSQSSGTASGTMVSSMVGMITAAILDPAGPVNWSRFDFSDTSAFTGSASGAGAAAKVGAVFKVNDKLAIGATYHSETFLGNLKSSNTKVTMNANIDDNYLAQTWDGAGTGTPAGTYTATTIGVQGDISVVDFQWPSVYGLGAAFKANDKLMLAADVKMINWSSVMKHFKMKFTASNTQTGMAQGFAGQVMETTMLQNWNDQMVIALGGAYKVSDKFTARAGVNTASNPVPKKFLNPMFPATVENHLTLGGGIRVGATSSVDFSVTSAFESSVTTDSNLKVTHSQLNAQVMYSHFF